MADNEDKKNGINVGSISFDEKGQMIVLDDETQELISGGSAPATNGNTNNLICPPIDALCHDNPNAGCESVGGLDGG
jgi:hypothetical protein